MKIIIIIFSLLFSLNIFCIDKYIIDSVSVKINNIEMVNKTELYVWKPYQKVNGELIINRHKKLIYIILENSILYNYDKNIFMQFGITDNLFYINDTRNKVEVLYKIKRIK